MGRAPCCEKNGLKKGPWTPEEDQKLLDYIHKHGYGNWRTLPKNAGLQRCGKSCRLRWTNYLRPDIKRGRFSFEEEETIIQLHSILGNKWSAIAARLPGRTDNEIKNYWNTHIRKRLMRMGIDPVTHTPRLDLLDLSRILNSSIYANSAQSTQVNFSRLLGLQPLININPELIRLATSLLSSQRRNQQDFLHQTNLIENPVQELLPIPTSSCFEAHDNNLVQYDPQSDLDGFGSIDLSTDLMEGDKYYDHGLVTNYGYNYGSDHHHQCVVMDNPVPALERSTFDQSNSSANNFSFQSVMSSNMSTPSTSSTPLHSNSAYNNINGSGTEDDRESYCSDLLKFEIPDIFDVNDFI
ncbi:hypothetical protein ABFS83_13G115000 [Erythranthe nasuta]